MTTTIDETKPKATIRMHKPRKWDGASLFEECFKQGVAPAFDGGTFLGYVSAKSGRKVKATSMPKDISISLFTAYRNAEKKGIAKTENPEPTKVETKKKIVAAKTEKSEGKRHRIDVTKKIHLKVTENPKRKESGSHKVFELYKEGMTVEEFLKLEKQGAHLGHIRWDVAHGFISLS
jgi:hypothetical protein